MSILKLDRLFLVIFAGLCLSMGAATPPAGPQVTKSVATIADLKGLNVNDKDKAVYVAGGTNVNDGQQGLFYYNPTGVIADGGVSFASTSFSGTWDRDVKGQIYYAKWWGATTTSNTLQAAIDYASTNGGTVLAGGVINVGLGIKLKSHVSLIAEQNAQLVLSDTPTTNYVLVTATNTVGAQITGFTLVGYPSAPGDTNNTGYGIDFSNSTNFVSSYNTFSGFYTTNYFATNVVTPTILDNVSFVRGFGNPNGQPLLFTIASLYFDSTPGNTNIGWIQTVDYGTNTWIPLGSGGSITSIPGGANKDIQFNNGGVFGGNSEFTLDEASSLVTLTNATSAGVTVTVVNSGGSSTSTQISNDANISSVVALADTGTGENYESRIVADIDDNKSLIRSRGTDGTATSLTLIENTASTSAIQSSSDDGGGNVMNAQANLTPTVGAFQIYDQALNQAKLQVSSGESSLLLSQGGNDFVSFDATNQIFKPTNFVQIISQQPSSSTNIALRVSSSTVWTNTGAALAKFYSGDTNRFVIRQDGAIIHGNPASAGIVAGLASYSRVFFRSVNAGESTNLFSTDNVFGTSGGQSYQTYNQFSGVGDKDIPAITWILATQGTNGSAQQSSLTANLGIGGLINEARLQLKHKGTNRVDHNTSVADSSVAVAHILDVTTNLVTSGAKLLSMRNAGVEKAYIDKDGNYYPGGSSVPGIVGAGTSGQVTLWDGTSSVTGATNFSFVNLLGTTSLDIKGNTTGKLTIEGAGNLSTISVSASAGGASWNTFSGNIVIGPAGSVWLAPVSNNILINTATNILTTSGANLSYTNPAAVVTKFIVGNSVGTASLATDAAGDTITVQGGAIGPYLLTAASKGVQVRDASFLPITDDIYDLGADSLRWKRLYMSSSMTAGGDTGNKTINKSKGRVNFAATSNTLQVINSYVVSTNSSVFPVVVGATNTVSLQSLSAGSFILELTPAASAETRVDFFVLP